MQCTYNICKKCENMRFFTEFSEWDTENLNQKKRIWTSITVPFIMGEQGSAPVYTPFSRDVFLCFAPAHATTPSSKWAVFWSLEVSSIKHHLWAYLWANFLNKKCFINLTCFSKTITKHILTFYFLKNLIMWLIPKLVLTWAWLQIGFLVIKSILTISFNISNLGMYMSSIDANVYKFSR